MMGVADKLGKAIDAATASLSSLVSCESKSSSEASDSSCGDDGKTTSCDARGAAAVWLSLLLAAA
jgi:hypothetical protein